MATTVLITGGTRGIGLGLARAFLERGCNVAVTGRSDASVAAAVEQLGATYGADRVAGAAGDVADLSATQAAWDEAVARFGQVDVLIANAGVSHVRRPLWELDEEDVRQVVEVNVLGAMWAARVAADRMRAQGHGAVYFMEGFGSRGETGAGISVYAASKRSAALLRDALRKDLGKDSPVRVGALSPGMVATDLLLGDYEDEADLERAKKFFNILGDRVETVTPWLADKVLADKGQGSRIAWLTKPKAFARFATSWRGDRDIFDDQQD